MTRNNFTRGAKLVFLVSFALFCAALGSRKAQDVLTERFNNARRGSTRQTLNSASLRQGWGKLGEFPVDGRVYAQPLFAQRANHLSGQTSPYLKRAVSQPVDWYPWGGEALKRARELNHPILLDVGAVWCEWCAVMDRESYNSVDLAAFINAHFVAVKVDYDAQPQLAAELERAQAILNLPSGLPLTSFVTPQGKLYFGGTYYPRKAQGDKPAFEGVLRQALRLYRQHRSEVEQNGVDLIKEK